jgi:hypothetical protein
MPTTGNPQKLSELQTETEVGTDGNINSDNRPKGVSLAADDDCGDGCGKEQRSKEVNGGKQWKIKRKRRRHQNQNRIEQNGTE